MAEHLHLNTLGVQRVAQMIVVLRHGFGGIAIAKPPKKLGDRNSIKLSLRFNRRIRVLPKQV